MEVVQLDESLIYIFIAFFLFLMLLF